MPDKKDNVFAGVEELKKAIAEEEKKRPAGLREVAHQAQVSYTILPTALPREHANLDVFCTKLQQRFGLTFDDSKLRGIMQGQGLSPARLMRHLIENDSTVVFHHGMLQLEQPARTTPIQEFGFSDESVAAIVVGSTFEAEWVAQKGLEELWAASGVTRPWQQIEKDVQLRAYLTTTRVNLGVNLVDLFSDKFKAFVNDELSMRGSFGPMMGKHPVDADLLLAEKGRIRTITHAKDIELQVTLFNELSGRSETCRVGLHVQSRHEMGQGRIVVTTELDSESHTALLHQLLRSLS